MISFGQGEKLVINIDNDNKKDTVYIDSKKSTIVCKLSTNNYRTISSKPIEILNFPSGFRKTKNGFEFYNDWMRAGYKNQFRYNIKTKKIQLIGMSRYEFGNAANDGSGESSVNLLTNDYSGNWNYYNMDKEELNSLPRIKVKMVFKTVNLENFNDAIYFGFAEKCADLYHKYKKISMKKNK